MSRLLCLTVVVFTFCVNGLSQEPIKTAAVPAGAQNDKPVIEKQVDLPDDYVIGVEDELSILVYREPELSTKGAVRPDGKVSIPLLDDIQASGLKPKELQEQIRIGLKKFLKDDPQVSVLVTQIRSLVVYVTGAVNKPGVYSYGGPISIMELLVRAGGLSEFAKSDKVQILRKDGLKQNRFLFNYKDFSKGKNLDQNIMIKPGDMVIVP